MWPSESCSWQRSGFFSSMLAWFFLALLYMCSGDGGATIPRVILLGSFSADQCDQTGENSEFSNVLVSSRAACCCLLAVCSYYVDSGDGAPPGGPVLPLSWARISPVLPTFTPGGGLGWSGAPSKGVRRALLHSRSLADTGGEWARGG